MSLSQIQNFYKSSLSLAINTNGATKIYVAALPSVFPGYLVISPTNTTKREIVAYDTIGTDVTGNYINVPNGGSRGLGGTTAQNHDPGESIRMNLTAQHWADMIAAFGSKIDTSVISTDATLGGASASDLILSTQKAVYTFVTGLINALTSSVNSALGGKVNNTGNESITGVKTFISAPIVPNGAASGEAVNYGQLAAAVISGGVPSTPTTLGISKLSKTADNPVQPISVGDNDDRLKQASPTNYGISRIIGSFDQLLDTVSISIASPAIFTRNSHGLIVDDIVTLSQGVIASGSYINAYGAAGNSIAITVGLVQTAILCVRTVSATQPVITDPSGTTWTYDSYGTTAGSYLHIFHAFHPSQVSGNTISIAGADYVMVQVFADIPQASAVQTAISSSGNVNTYVSVNTTGQAGGVSVGFCTVVSSYDIKFSTGNQTLNTGGKVAASYILPTVDGANTFTTTALGSGLAGGNSTLAVAIAFKKMTSSVLPTGLSYGVPYFVIADGIGTNVFELSSTKRGTAINTSGYQSGTHLITRNGAVFQGFVGVKAYQNAANSNTTAWGAIPFQTEVFDTNAMHDNVTNNARITIQVSGKYNFGGSITPASGSTMACYVRLNGSTNLGGAEAGASSVGGVTGPQAPMCSVSGIHNFVAGDYIEFIVAANSAGIMSSGSLDTNFWAYKIG